MTRIKLYVPTLPELEKEFKQLGLSKFKKKYSKINTLIGSSESINFIMEKINLLV